jgi:hypothetical protein
MGWLRPARPPYDLATWERWSFAARAQAVCRAWALQGYGTPIAVFVAYLLKVALYVLGFVVACAVSPDLVGEPPAGRARWIHALLTLPEWWAHPLAFTKAIVWSALFEVLGLGCGSGPLTGRYWPPFTAFAHWLWPGTTRLPAWPGLPWPFAGHRRTWFDVALYAGLLVALALTLAAPAPGWPHLAAIAGLVPLIGLRDRTIVLALRAEHYWVTTVVLLAAAVVAAQPQLGGELGSAGATRGMWAGAQAVQLALWWWAGVSKLNHHFPTVVGVMVSNGPITRIPALRRAMYRSFPEDLRPSRLATWLAHGGTALELGVPLVLAFAGTGPERTLGLVLMVLLHGYITSSVPMGVPIEWNVMVVYGAFVLFGAHGDVRLADLGGLGPTLAPAVGALLVVCLVGLPLAGNLWPRRLSFLLSMRYYAGNWPYSVYLFRGESWRKLERVRKVAPWVEDQLGGLYDHETTKALIAKVIAFRLMHLQGRVLHTALPAALADAHGQGDGALEQRTWLDGELVAGLVLGWNFGDGHLHQEQFLAALQAQCQFEPGELRCVFVESQPLHRAEHVWRCVDAATGELARGVEPIADMRARQPWPPLEAGAGVASAPQLP